MPEAKNLATAGASDAPLDDSDLIAEMEIDEVTEDVSGEHRPAGGTLLPRVQELLTRVFNAEERARYERFFTAAAVAIEALGALDLSHIDEFSTPAEGNRILDTLPAEINVALDEVDAFLDRVGRDFPVADATDDDDFDFDLGPIDSSAAESAEKVKVGEEIAKTLNAFTWNIGHELRTLRDSFAEPAADSDPWSVLERIAEFRGRTRSGIGEAFFIAAREFAVVRKGDVVPFYKEDVDRSLALRRAITVLRARIDVHRTRLERMLAADDRPTVRETLAAFHEIFDGFTRGDAYPAMRVVDRRSCLDLREELAELAKAKEPGKRRIETSIEGLAKFLDSLTLVNQRELLVTHDNEATADTETQLGAVDAAVAANDPTAAREALHRAVRTAEPLFGRDPTFDGLLKLMHHIAWERFSLDDVLGLAGLIRRQL